jgi:murein DD-endopeptidase MepM/ murein hydrolase activator NlpD
MAHRVFVRHLAGRMLALLAGLALLTAACAVATPTSQPSPATATASRAPVIPTSRQAGTATPSAAPTVPPTATTLPFQACSPLLGIAPQDLAGIVFNPYNPPPLGSDDPHQGVDLAQVVDGMALSGLPVQAVLPGRVALVVSGRFPYGNAVLVETPLDELPAGWLAALDLPSVPATPVKRTALTCPTPAAPATLDFEKRSLYLLYAHMLEAPNLSAGEALTCGQAIGAIGSSGNALNPHLHLEVRIGPAGVRFPGMAHYDSGASPEEMAAYCQWRVSGAFLTIDPLLLFQAKP